MSGSKVKKTFLQNSWFSWGVLLQMQTRKKFLRQNRPENWLKALKLIWASAKMSEHSEQNKNKHKSDSNKRREKASYVNKRRKIYKLCWMLTLDRRRKWRKTEKGNWEKAKIIIFFSSFSDCSLGIVFHELSSQLFSHSLKRPLPFIQIKRKVQTLSVENPREFTLICFFFIKAESNYLLFQYIMFLTPTELPYLALPNSAQNKNDGWNFNPLGGMSTSASSTYPLWNRSTL